MTTQDFTHLIQTRRTLPDHWLVVMEHGCGPKTALTHAIADCDPADVLATRQGLQLAYMTYKEAVSQRSFNPILRHVKKQKQAELELLEQVLTVFDETLELIQRGVLKPPAWQGYI